MDPLLIDFAVIGCPSISPFNETERKKQKTSWSKLPLSSSRGKGTFLLMRLWHGYGVASHSHVSHHFSVFRCTPLSCFLLSTRTVIVILKNMYPYIHGTCIIQKLASENERRGNLLSKCFKLIEI